MSVRVCECKRVLHTKMVTTFSMLYQGAGCLSQVCLPQPYPHVCPPTAPSSLPAQGQIHSPHSLPWVTKDSVEFPFTCSD